MLDRRSAPVSGWHEEERHAGICALGGNTLATAIVKSTAAGEQTVLTVHGGQRKPRIVRLSGRLPLCLWASAATGATAILQNGRMLVLTASGARRVWRAVAAAVAIRPSQLLLFRASGPPTTQSFLVRASTPAAVEMAEAVVDYGPRASIGPVSVSVPSGGVLGLLGANGSGKTSIMRALCALEPLRSGSVEVLGNVVRPGIPELPAETYGRAY